ncbi:MAG: phenylalanine--tRNA ligase subunit alpha [Myxococcales bacterium]|nr:phenylalanine--tRNA ligase subunit alpha [Myxococcales bacterium]
MLDRLEKLEADGLAAIAAADRDALEALRVAYLGKQGHVAQILRTLGQLPKEERKALGQGANRVKGRLAQAIAQRERSLAAEALELELSERLDLSLPGALGSDQGVAHPLRRVQDEITGIFTRLGYQVASGPEVEDDWHNFSALNIPPDHPARDMQDTFYLEDGRLLRTHTSPVQIRSMLENSPPLRLIAPGAVYRCDADVTHSPMFHQVEGLLVDRDISFAHLKGTLAHFAREMFGPQTQIRLRTSFFPFTEPSAEVDVSCIFCDGDGCRVCSDTGWLEILGCGMVDPNVLQAVDIDPTVYSGFAFGMGVERIAMLRYRVPDIRLFFDSRIDFLEQFKQLDREAQP